MSPDASAAASVTSARARDSGIGSVAGSSAGDRRRVGEDVRQPRAAELRRHRYRAAAGPQQPAASPATSAAASRTARPAAPPSRRAAATDTCWPSTARIAISFPSTAPTARRPGQPAASGPITGSPAKKPEIAAGSASRSSSRRHALHGGGHVAQVRQRQRAVHPVRTGNEAQREHPATVRQADRPRVLGRQRPPRPREWPARRGSRTSAPGRSAAGTAAAAAARRPAVPAGRRRRPPPASGRRRTAGRPPPERRPGRARRPVPAARAARVVHLEHRRVELPDGGEARPRRRCRPSAASWSRPGSGRSAPAAPWPAPAAPRRPRRSAAARPGAAE